MNTYQIYLPITTSPDNCIPAKVRDEYLDSAHRNNVRIATSELEQDINNACDTDNLLNIKTAALNEFDNDTKAMRHALSGLNWITRDLLQSRFHTFELV